MRALTLVKVNFPSVWLRKNRSIFCLFVIPILLMGMFVLGVQNAEAAVAEVTAPAAAFATGNFNPNAAIPVVSFAISQDAGETLTSVIVTVTSEAGPAVAADFANLRVYKEDGTTAGFQIGEDTAIGVAQAAINIGAATTINAGADAIGAGPGGTIYYVVATLSNSPGNGNQFSVDVATGAGAAVVLSAGAVSLTVLDGSTQAIATILVPPVIPTLNQWGVIIFGILLGLSSIVILKRRGRTASSAM